MAAENRDLSIREIGYRRLILFVGIFWGVAPSLSFGLQTFINIPQSTLIIIFNSSATVLLGILYELDSRRVNNYANGVPLAWAYALLVPICIILLPMVHPFGQTLGYIIGPPLSAIIYLFQRGRLAEFEKRTS